MTSLSPAQLDELRNGFEGEIVRPDDAGYAGACRVWNAMIDKHPAIVARCRTTADVVRAVKFARARGLALAVRGGGHNIAGNALVDDGIVIDLSAMKAVKVDPAAKRVTVEGGALLGDVDAATLAHGLAVPLGINSTTGVGGLTLGGGFGWIGRKFGMTVDSLESAEVVTAAGDVVVASEKSHGDLFWALRGGGGNFGVVTRFTFRLHPVGPEVLSGLVVHPLADGAAVLRHYREFTANMPDELSVYIVARNAPPLPFLAPEVHGKGVVVVAFAYAGDPKEGERLVAPLRAFGKPYGEAVGVQPFAAWQTAFDPLLAPGSRNYWKSHNLAKLEDGFFDALLGAVANLPSDQCEVLVCSLGGAMSRPAPGATAYAQRDAKYVMNVHGRWEDAADDARCVAWARGFFEAAAPYATGGVYVNFLTAEEADRVAAAYGPNYARLADVKRVYDPDNLFRVNWNIQPA